MSRRHGIDGVDHFRCLPDVMSLSKLSCFQSQVVCLSAKDHLVHGQVFLIDCLYITMVKDGAWFPCEGWIAK